MNVESLQKIISESLLDKDLIFTSLGNLGGTILGALMWFIIASLVDVSNYGRVNYLIAVSVVPASIAVFGLNTTVTTFVAKGNEKIAFESNSIILITSIVIGGIVFYMYGVETALITVSLVFFMMSLSYLLGLKKYKEYSLVIIFQKITQILSSVILYLIIGINGILYGYALGPLLFSFRYFESLKKFTTNFSMLKRHIGFIFHSFGINMTNVLSSYFDKIVIGLIFGFSVLGIYQLAFQFLMLIMVLPNILSTYLLPQEASGIIRKEVKIMGIASSFLVTLANIFVTPYVVSNIFPSYENSIPLIQIMGISIIPFTLATLSTAKLLGREESKMALIGGIVYIISLLISIILLGSFLGIAGLAISIVIAHSLRSGYLVLKAGI